MCIVHEFPQIMFVCTYDNMTEAISVFYFFSVFLYFLFVFSFFCRYFTALSRRTGTFSPPFIFNSKAQKRRCCVMWFLTGHTREYNMPETLRFRSSLRLDRACALCSNTGRLFTRKSVGSLERFVILHLHATIRDINRSSSVGSSSEFSFIKSRFSEIMKQV